MGLFYIRATGVRIFRAICSDCTAALGTFDTRVAAENHERAVQYFKRRS
jgi:hypothetical protein